MQDYLQRTRLADALDELGKWLLLLVAGFGWFLCLWGLSLRALLAGGALFLFLMVVRAKTSGRRLRAREARLRRVIGGELALADMLTAPARRAHFQAALLLSRAYPVALCRMGEHGTVCEQAEETLLVAFSPTPAAMPVTAHEIAGFQRACREACVKRGVLMACADADAGAKRQAALSPCVRVVGGKEALALAGSAHPATDAQLAALAKQKRMGMRASLLFGRALDRKKAPRYALYGAFMLILFVITGQVAYAVPGIACIVLAGACRLTREKREKTL